MKFETQTTVGFNNFVFFVSTGQVAIMFRILER